MPGQTLWVEQSVYWLSCDSQSLVPRRKKHHFRGAGTLLETPVGVLALHFLQELGPGKPQTDNSE